MNRSETERGGRRRVRNAPRKTNRTTIDLSSSKPSFPPRSPPFPYSVITSSSPGGSLGKGEGAENFAEPSRHPWIASAAEIAPAEKRGEGRRGRDLKTSIIIEKTPQTGFPSLLLPCFPRFTSPRLQRGGKKGKNNTKENSPPICSTRTFRSSDRFERGRRIFSQSSPELAGTYRHYLMRSWTLREIFFADGFVERGGSPVRVNRLVAR